MFGSTHQKAALSQGRNKYSQRGRAAGAQMWPGWQGMETRGQRGCNIAGEGITDKGAWGWAVLRNKRTVFGTRMDNVHCNGGHRRVQLLLGRRLDTRIRSTASARDKLSLASGGGGAWRRDVDGLQRGACSLQRGHQAGRHLLRGTGQQMANASERRMLTCKAGWGWVGPHAKATAVCPRARLSGVSVCLCPEEMHALVACRLLTGQYCKSSSQSAGQRATSPSRASSGRARQACGGGS